MKNSRLRCSSRACANATDITLILLTRCRRSGIQERLEDQRAVHGLGLFWVRDTQTVFIFSSFGTVVFFSFNTGSESEIIPCDDGWVDFNSFINPIWDKAGSHIVGIAELLQQTTKKGNIIDTTRRDPSLLPPCESKDCYGQFLYLLLNVLYLGKIAFGWDWSSPISILSAFAHLPAPY